MLRTHTHKAASMQNRLCMTKLIEKNPNQYATLIMSPDRHANIL